ncbi:type III restriction/modification enzyme restriction subunit [Nocardiopsis sp. Huas11]|uniref:DEAD/DEAH box helicase family protein n=1 Tax=Nocardiopsis sp. Huas11 TaxID=2183912 RepID=UPI000EAE0A67|nr:DEAD/DEAH box helicase family protein [Nocardiopsis sp. Huas11]RKS06758.1 type III restriction/modification enzyme restriction subunit [Nocardiopsis sp. Huas11]
MPDTDREGPPGPEGLRAPEPSVFAAAAWPGEFRPYQDDALSEVASRWADGHRRTWVVLPPGAGKTLVGLEAARRLGRRTVVFAPNIAIQGQWITHWEAYDRPDGGTAGTGRALEDDLNVLTYQSLAVFDPEAETDGSGSVRDRLHPNGQALVRALHDAGPLTVVLDECHHLLQVWGRLLAEILDELPDAHVIGLTGTPAASLTRTEKKLVERLFGEPITGASVPALVRDGYLAPFAELAYVTVPNALEREYLAEEGLRFTEMCAELLTSGFAETDFLAWIDVRFVDRFTAGQDEADWNRLANERPEEADAVLRLHHAGLCALPRGARPSERHRHPPDADDWAALLKDYERHCLDPDNERNTAARQSIRAALPTVGYQLTRRGIRATASPVDRVLARSAAKSQATVEIVDTESDALGDRLRALVLCDQERARTPRALRGVLAEDAGSAWLQLALLVEDPRTAFLNPVMITGRTVATSPWTSDALVGFVRAERPDLDLDVREVDGLHVIEGTWPPRTRIGLVTRFLDWAGCRVLVGTRALLGEGWDARGINVVVDLTTSTTATAVLQGRGRALRLDPSWPEKTAHTWTVVCVSHDHPKGDADWNRFVRKHEGYLALGTDGGVVSGVAHVDARLSPYEPPPEGEADAINARMLIRAGAREETREQWRLGEPYDDTLTAALRVWERQAPSGHGGVLAPGGASAHGGARTHGGVSAGAEVPALGSPPAVLPAAAGAVRGATPPGDSETTPTHATVVVRSLSVVVGFVLGVSLGPLQAGVLMALLCLAASELVAAGARRMARVRQARHLLEQAREPIGIDRFACAVADALRYAGHSEVGSEGVRVHVDTAGVHQCTLTGAGPEAAEKFAVALEEVLNPVVANERFMAAGLNRWYLAIRHELPVPGSAREEREWARAQARGDAAPNRRVYHAVPHVFERRLKGPPQDFERAWNRWVSPEPLLYLLTIEAGDALTEYQEMPAEVTTGFGLIWS